MISKTELELLQRIADIQDSLDIDSVEDTQLAEEADLDVGLVQHALESLSDDGYVRLERVERLSGAGGYTASLLSDGERLLDEARPIPS